MWKRILKYLIGAVTIVTLVIGTQVVTAETGLIVKLPKPITNIASELGQSFTLGMVGVAYATTPDYICDGVADDVEIQAAMNALPATGGELFFFGGNYVLTATVTRAINNISIVGSGKSTYFANDGGTAIFSAGVQTGWEFKDFRTDAGYLTLTTDTVINRVWNVNVLEGAPSGTTYFVASYTASESEKASANWICDGTADDVEINAALAALPAVGGRVMLSQGYFYITTTITLGATLNELVGQGTATALYLVNNSDCDMLVIPENSSKCTISDMRLIGNKANNASGRGIVVYGYGWYPHLENLTIESFKQQNLRFTTVSGNYTYNALVRNVDSRLSDDSGIFLTYVSDSFFDFVTSNSNAVYGVYDNSTATTFNQLHCHDNASTAYESLTECTHNSYFQLTVENNDDTGAVIGGSYNSFVGLLAFDNSRSAANTYDGVYITGDYNVFTNGEAYDTGVAWQRYGFITQVGGDNNIFIGNYNWGNVSAQMLDLGANNVFKDNKGYVTENSGQATLLNANTSIVVNHGLSVTPTTITITWLEDPTNPIGDWWVDTIGATQFTLHGVNPGASNLDFRWTASKY